MSAEDQAAAIAAQMGTIRAVVMFQKLTETKPTAEDLSVLAALYAKQGLYDDAKATYLRTVRMGLQHGN